MRSRPIPPRALWAMAAMGCVIAAQAALWPVPAPEIADDWGTPVVKQSLTTEPALPRLTLHTGCRIQRFGMHPWAASQQWNPERRQATQAALILMGLPRETARRATAAMEHTDPHTALSMGNLGGVDLRGVSYSPIYTTSYKSEARGRVVCMDSKTAFASDERVETAVIWLIDGYTVGYYLRCNNVTRFTQGPLLERLPPDPSGIAAIRPFWASRFVPEPSSAWLVLAGLGALALGRKQNARN